MNWGIWELAVGIATEGRGLSVLAGPGCLELGRSTRLVESAVLRCEIIMVVYSGCQGHSDGEGRNRWEVHGTISRRTHACMLCYTSASAGAYLSESMERHVTFQHAQQKAIKSKLPRSYSASVHMGSMCAALELPLPPQKYPKRDRALSVPQSDFEFLHRYSDPRTSSVES